MPCSVFRESEARGYNNETIKGRHSLLQDAGWFRQSDGDSLRTVLKQRRGHEQEESREK